MKSAVKLIHFSAALLLIFLCAAKAVYAPFFVPLSDRCYKYIILALALSHLYLLRFSQGGEVKLAAAYWVWLLLTRLLLGRACLTSDHSLVVDTAVYVLLLAVGQAADARERLLLADITALFLAVPAAVSAAVCIGGALMQTQIFYPHGESVYTLFDLERLMVFGLHPNISSMWFFLGAAMAVYLALRFRRLWWAAIPALLLNYAAIGLTGSRSVMLCCAFCFPLLVVLLLMEHYSIKRNRARALTVVAVLLLLAPLTYKGFSLSNRGIAALSDKAASRRTAAAVSAELPAPTEFSPAPLAYFRPETVSAEVQGIPADRGFGDSGRLLTWKTAITTLRAEPRRLFIGCDTAHLMDYSNPILEQELHFQNNNYHNVLVNLLVATGLPGLLIVLVLLVSVAVKCFRLFFSEADLAMKSLILPVAAAYIYNMLEAVLFFKNDFRTLPVFLLMGLLIAEHTQRARGNE